MNWRIAIPVDQRKARLLGPFILLTLGGLALLVLLAFFLVARFDEVAAAREQGMVSNGFARQLNELDEVIMPQVAWDDAVKALDHKRDLRWADYNLGSYLFTFNGFTRAFVVDSAGKPFYAAVRGKRAGIETFAPFRKIAEQLLPPIRAAERARPPIVVSSGKDSAKVPPIQANGTVWVNGHLYIVIATLVQPDVGLIKPTGPRAPVAIMAMPVDGKLLQSFSERYMVDDLQLFGPNRQLDDRSSFDFYDPAGALVARLHWTPKAPGRDLMRNLWPAALAAIAALALIAWIVVRSGARIVSELVASEARSRHMAFHDALTKLPNRAMLFARLQPMLAEASERTKLAVLAVDLDRFKVINDMLGHHAGDALIGGVANRLREVCAEASLIARLGGDEFIVLCEASSADAADELATRIVKAIRRPFDSEYGPLEVGCSVGVALVDHPGIEPSEALRWADLALYRSKESGRNRVTLFEAEMDVALRTRRSLEADLRTAISDGLLAMVYQPQVNRSGRVVAVEALVRWMHPERGAVPPSVFVPLAEESGLILALGEQVLRKVFSETGRWSSTRVAINVSPVQLRSQGFAALVTRLAAEAGISPERYEIELTETALLGDDPVTAGNVEALKRLGFSIALDDFGTGYSSLSVLQRFSVDKIKIDRSFVAALGGADESEALVDAMIKLARALELDVIAEGVETEKQMERLELCGCREFQGHLLGMPMPANDVALSLGEEPTYREAALKRLA